MQVMDLRLSRMAAVGFVLFIGAVIAAVLA